MLGSITPGVGSATISAVFSKLFAHAPVEGVNVNVTLLPEVEEAQVPEIPLSEVVGREVAAGTEPSQYLSFNKEAKVGVTLLFTVTVTVRSSVAVQLPLVAVTTTV